MIENQIIDTKKDKEKLTKLENKFMKNYFIDMPMKRTNKESASLELTGTENGTYVPQTSVIFFNKTKYVSRIKNIYLVIHNYVVLCTM